MKTNASRAYASLLDKQFRIHRKGKMPSTDHSTVGNLITQTQFEFIDGKIASSGDLAFTYGKYSIVPHGIQDGYYVHVWRRDANSKWRLVADVQNPLPKSEN